MIGLPSLAQLDNASATRIWLCPGPTDMRRGFDRLAEQSRQVTRRDPRSGHLFVFRSRRGDRLKVLHWDRGGRAGTRSVSSSGRSTRSGRRWRRA